MILYRSRSLIFGPENGKAKNIFYFQKNTLNFASEIILLCNLLNAQCHDWTILHIIPRYCSLDKAASFWFPGVENWMITAM